MSSVIFISSNLIFPCLFPGKCTWLHGFTSHLKVQTWTRQGTVVAGLTAAWQFSSRTALSLPWTYWTQDTSLWATPKSQDTEQADVLVTLHLNKQQEKRVYFVDSKTDVRCWYICVWVTLLGSCGYYRTPLLWVWESHYTLNPLPPPPSPLLFPQSNTAPCWPPLLHTIHCRLLA